MPFLVIQILQLKMKPIDFLPRLCCCLFGISDLTDCISVQASQPRKIRVEELLLFRQLKLDFQRWRFGGCGSICFNKVDEIHALLPGTRGGVENGLEVRVCDGFTSL